MAHRLKSEPHPMLWFAKDLPNLISLVGLGSAIIGSYYAILGVFPAAMIGLIWAVVFDWLDGRVARKMSGRTKEQREYGAQLDSLIDVISFGVAPMVVLISVGGFQLPFMLGGFVVLAAAVIRLAYFNTFGMVDGSTYRGLALDNNVIILVALFAFQPVLDSSVFLIVLFGLLMVLALLNVAPIRTPKLGGNWYFAILMYAIAMSALYTWQLLNLAL
ncbi:MAG: CDP-alcohol phosphatidyltransferase family protein [Coriobacteriia bacterium]|nr:CDP-alcohol phosphatidyltransferase family protein [Coriobacteriia bacterium]